MSIYLTALNLSIPVVLGGVGWFIRRCIVKYERALVSAERQRAHAAEKELEEIKAVVAGLHAAMAKVTRDHEAMRSFMTEWGRKITGEFNSLLKLSQSDVDELKGALSGMVTLLGPVEKTSVKEIAKDVYLVKKPPEKKGSDPK